MSILINNQILNVVSGFIVVGPELANREQVPNSYFSLGIWGSSDRQFW